jgi:hypothetical protein
MCNVKKNLLIYEHPALDIVFYTIFAFSVFSNMVIYFQRNFQKIAVA